ncbi:DUF927 domain-containing protein [Paraburkholderia sp. EG286B]|uniref:DUF927 domain-containing protein n=1 Tax=Paraburkholderia sp. EG286B TaxID=3237011 RepID=UPI0034D25998
MNSNSHGHKEPTQAEIDAAREAFFAKAPPDLRESRTPPNGHNESKPAPQRRRKAARPDDADVPTIFPSLDDRPCWRLYDEPFQHAGRAFAAGVYFHGIRHVRNDSTPLPIDRWICSPLRVLAVTRNREDDEHGRLLEFRAPSGRWRKWAMPMPMLAGDGNEVRAVLLSGGLTFNMDRRGDVLQYIAAQMPEHTMRAATATGWHDGSFVLPAQVLGAEDIWFQAMGRTAPYASAGTIAGWREMAALARGNRLLMLSIAAAFAGTLLRPLGMTGAALHLFGDSSTGKTTAARGAASVWGGEAFVRTWRATANGLEGAGQLHTDTMLPLDEIGEIDPRHLYEVAYALINGTGKSRANRYGEARQAAHWRVFALSTGETTLAARMQTGGFSVKAGQELRFLDVPVAGRYGVLDELHGRTSAGVLSDEIRALAARHYGLAGPLFAEALVRELASGLDLLALHAPVLARFSAADGQQRRAAQTFAACALAGELAVQWGVVPWEAGEPTDAALHAFRLWYERRPDEGRGSEHAAILRAVADFLDRHGDSRFSSIEGSGDLIRDRAGYYRFDGGRRLYLLTAGGMREATKGYDLMRALRALDEAGAITERGKGGEVAKVTHTPDGKKRLYHIEPEALDKIVT